MMPFRWLEKESLPKEYHGYWPMLLQCKQYSNSPPNSVCYLTIHESEVSANSSQRRPGLHIDRPGGLSIGGGNWIEVYWGDGERSARMGLEGGIFMANTVRGSCEVWDTCISSPMKCVWKHGDIEHLRQRCFLNVKSEKLLANTLYWMTDRTPHESVPMKKGTYRQFFDWLLKK
eukprot:TRINITY_DN4376_c0_g1_i2.p1 TRINITY_DN4376_c0_g1~~TRINITY_DN4376_c0_g1_i2.p1  ORF type:complete len:174 (+),score=8.89 TRINITY_DN4376_c0_g1_i2:48-569(+)